MAIISLNKHELQRSVTQTSQKRFYYALRKAGFEPLLATGISLPPQLRSRLIWAKLEKWLPSSIIHISYVGFAILFLAVQDEVMHWAIAILLGLPLIPFTAFLFYIHTEKWAQQNVQKLLETPFLFIYNGDIYENFPNLRKLDDEIEILKKTQIQTEQSILELKQLSKDMKEQLILLGQDTNDQYLQGLESQRMNQIRLLEKSQELLQIAMRSRQEQIKLQQELLDWAELDRMRQQASQISGQDSKQQSWQKMTALEMRAAELAFQMHELNHELHNSLAKKVAQNEVR